jgi:hypothetical protein
MDFLFRQKYTYCLPDPLEDTKNKLLVAAGNRSSVFSSRLPEIVAKDGSFSLRSNFTLFNFVNYGQTVYLKGQIVPAEVGSKINIILSPNFVFPLCIYLLLLVSLNVLFGDNSFMGSNAGRIDNFIIIMIMVIVIFSLVQINSHFMRRKFEKAIRII